MDYTLGDPNYPHPQMPDGSNNLYYLERAKFTCCLNNRLCGSVSCDEYLVTELENE